MKFFRPFGFEIPSLLEVTFQEEMANAALSQEEIQQEMANAALSWIQEEKNGHPCLIALNMAAPWWKAI